MAARFAGRLFFEDREFLTSLGLYELQKYLGGMMSDGFQGNVLVVEWSEHGLEKRFDADWRETV
jgi:hypothetical protein